MSSIRQELAYAYQILAYLKLDDHTYTHLSARDPDHPEHFYIYPFGLRFEEVTAESLMKVTLDGEVIEGNEYQYNQTGYIIHGAIYQARPDLNAIFHLHTPDTIAVSALTQGLLPLSQWALHFYNRVSYHDYNSLSLEVNQGQQLVNDLAQNKIMLLRHHGFITAGQTLAEAMFYTHHLQLACQTQCLILAMNQPHQMPNPIICQKSVNDLLSFEVDLGQRDWQAWKRMIDRKLS